MNKRRADEILSFMSRNGFGREELTVDNVWRVVRWRRLFATKAEFFASSLFRIFALPLPEDQKEDDEIHPIDRGRSLKMRSDTYAYVHFREARRGIGYCSCGCSCASDGSMQPKGPRQPQPKCSVCSSLFKRTRKRPNNHLCSARCRHQWRQRLDDPNLDTTGTAGCELEIILHAYREDVIRSVLQPFHMQTPETTMRRPRDDAAENRKMIACGCEEHRADHSVAHDHKGYGKPKPLPPARWRDLTKKDEDIAKQAVKDAKFREFVIKKKSTGKSTGKLYEDVLGCDADLYHEAVIIPLSESRKGKQLHGRDLRIRIDSRFRSRNVAERRNYEHHYVNDPPKAGSDDADGQDVSPENRPRNRGALPPDERTEDPYDLSDPRFSKLDATQRQILLLSHVEEKTDAAIAEHLGISQPTVWRQRNKAEKILKAC